MSPATRHYDPIGNLSQDHASFDAEGRLVGGGRTTVDVYACSGCAAVVTDPAAHEAWHRLRFPE